MTYDILSTLDWKDIAAIISIIIGIASILSYIWSKIVKPIYEFSVKILKYMSKLEENTILLENISKEFKPNGGSTLKDALNRLEQNQLVVNTKIQSLIIYHRIAAFETDADGQCAWVSKRWSEINGLSQEEAMGSGWVLGIVDEDRERVQSEWNTSLDDVRAMTIQYRVGREKVTKVQCTTVVIKDVNGSVIGYLGLLNEI